MPSAVHAQASDNAEVIQTPAASPKEEVSAPLAEPGPAPIDKRIFGVLPNYRTASSDLEGTTITAKHLETACELDQLDQLGLDATEQAYLRILADGPARLNMLATRIGLPIQTVQRVTEASLVRLGLIGKDKTGVRELTAQGREHLSGLRPENG